MSYNDFLSKIKGKTLVMGILNLTPDSFYDGGKFDSIDNAVKKALQMEEEGADIIDIGGESTRPGSKNISSDEEIERVIPVIEELLKKIKIPLSIDSYKSNLVKKALDLGVSMVNDVTALQGDRYLVNIISDYDVPVCLMHMKGNPRDMQIDPTYDDIILEIKSFLKERTDFAIFNGIKPENIIIDPGIGFGKRTGKGIEDNCEILRNLAEFKKLGFPILVGPSRKSFIGNICGKKDKMLCVDKRLGGSIAACIIAVKNGADIVRVHDVLETRCAIDLFSFIQKM